jgi:5-methylcytosine-specific restriction enzyme A
MIVPKSNRPYRARGYTYEWDRLSREFKRRCPVCLGCWVVGVETPTEIVDHIVPLAHDQASLLDISNLQPACRWHHDNVKRSLELQWRLGQLPESALRLDGPQAKRLTRERYLIPVGVDGYRLWEWGQHIVHPYPYRDE